MPPVRLYGGIGGIATKSFVCGVFIMYHKKLGRVHWLLWHLDPLFLKSYRFFYNYDRHNYVFYRPYIRKPYDLFIINRTSKRCFRVSYCNFVSGCTLYRSFTTSKKCADFLYDVFSSNVPVQFSNNISCDEWNNSS